MKKEEIEKKTKIKDLIFKIIHSITYVLSALFIIVCIAVGVQSCNSKNKKVNTESKQFNTELRSNVDNLMAVNQYESFNVYKLKYSAGTHELSLGFESDLLPNQSDLFYPNINVADRTFSLSFDYNAYVLKDNQLVLINEIRCFFTSQRNSNNLSYLALSNYYFIYEGESQYSRIFTKQSNSFDDRNYDFSFFNENYLQVFVFQSINDLNQDINVSYFNYFFEKINSDFLNYSFNYQINYNGFYNASLSSPYIPYSSLSTDIDLPFFISGGNLYNRIHLQFTDAQGSSFLDNSNNVFSLVASANTYMTYLYMEYVNTYSGASTLVNTRDLGVKSNGSNVSRYNLNSSSWVSNNYRYIKFLENPSNNDLNILSKFNSNTSNVNNGSYYSDIGLGSVFTLLSNAFSGLIGLFTIQLIPGITIGILLFMPLIVGIIIVIVKMVKK